MVPWPSKIPVRAEQEREHGVSVRWLKVSILEKQRKAPSNIQIKRKSQSSEMAFSLSGMNDQSFLHFIMVPYAGSLEVENMQVKKDG
jgi:hypothetical protein